MSQNELQRLMPTHFQIVDLCLAGYGVREIAQAVGQTPQNISLVTKSPLFQDELARRRKSVEAKTDTLLATTTSKAKEILEANASSAASTLVNGLRSDDEKIQLASAQDILNRTIGKGEESRSPSIIINVESMQVLQTALAESDADRKAFPKFPQELASASQNSLGLESAVELESVPSSSTASIPTSLLSEAVK